MGQRRGECDAEVIQIEAVAEAMIRRRRDVIAEILNIKFLQTCNEEILVSSRGR